jgi:NADH-quinone oxidoreductase subunit G/NADP-reducing hydrogenase subunit HndD
MNIEVNNKIIQAQAGDTILDALKRNGMSVPTLCYLKDLFPSGACRMCVVELEGARNLVTACSYPAAEGMKIKTHSDRVIHARKTIVELLLSNHPDDCLYCIRNNRCELQTLAAQHNITERRISGKKNEYKLDISSASIVRDPAKCILCGRCVRVCEEVEGVSAIDFAGRGNQTIIETAFRKGMNVSSCINCGQCITVCPTGALDEFAHFKEIHSAINDPKKKVIVQHAPSISITLAEEFGLAPGTNVIGVMNAALRKIGFDVVFDSSFTADLTIMEESAELIHRIQNGGVLPMFTSCCPGWVKYAEQFHPEMLPNLSTCKSPQQMMGALIKGFYAKKVGLNPEDIYSVGIMPCTAKKFEAQREEMTHNGISDVDAVLTTRELAKLIRLYGIDVHNIQPELSDNPLGTRSSAGKLFGASGGVMEAAIRTAYFKLTGEEMKDYKVETIRQNKLRREMSLNVAGLELNVAVVTTFVELERLLKDIKEGKSKAHFVEVMACPQGCISGGGQPIVPSPEAIKKRREALYDIDDKSALRASHQNPFIIQLYKEYLGEPLGEKSHHYLHTHYKQRDVLL